MDVLAKLDEMIAAKQSDINDLGEMKAEFEKLQAAPAPAAGGGDDDLKAQLDKAKADVEAIVKERDALRSAIKVEIDDNKKDTERLEAAVAPVVEAPAPVIPDVPVDAVDGPTAGPTAQL